VSKLSDSNQTEDINFDVALKEDYALSSVDEVNLGVLNGSVPKDFYSQNPCTVGYSYIRFEVDGSIRPCCISKYEIGKLSDGDWRVTWHSTAWMSFRKKLAKIHIEKFHLNDADWLFCQQCSHLPINQKNITLLSRNSN
jgi:radical SAM protein with 4Fe4S-binding SPASM domain